MENSKELLDFFDYGGLSNDDSQRVQHILRKDSTCEVGKPQFAWILFEKAKAPVVVETSPEPVTEIPESVEERNDAEGITFGGDPLPPMQPLHPVPPYHFGIPPPPHGPPVTVSYPGPIAVMPHPQYGGVPVTFVGMPHPGMGHPMAAMPPAHMAMPPMMHHHPPPNIYQSPSDQGVGNLPHMAVADMYHHQENMSQLESQNYQQNTIQPASKPYERRNKKRRPPDYYKKMEAREAEERRIHEASRFQDNGMDIQSNNIHNQEQLRDPTVHQHGLDKEPSPVPIDVNRNFQPNVIAGSPQMVSHTTEEIPSNNEQNILPEFGQVSISNQIYNDGSRTGVNDGLQSNMEHSDIERIDSMQFMNSESQICAPPVDSHMVHSGKEASPDNSNYSGARDVVTVPAPQSNTESNVSPDDKQLETNSQASTIISPPATNPPSEDISPTINTEQSQQTSIVPSSQPATPPKSSPQPSPPITSQPVNTDTTTTTTTPAPPAEAAQAPPPAKPAAWGKPNSWAGLFSGTKQAQNATVIYSAAAPSNTSDNPPPAPGDKKKDDTPATITADEDKNSKKLGDFLSSYALNHKSISLQPRGLTNVSVWCYINATLQALLACPPFFHLMKSLPSVKTSTKGPTSTPVLDTMMQFINEFSPMAIKPLDNKTLNDKGTVKQDIPVGKVFEPTYVYKLLKLNTYDSAFKLGRQEDAEEFLSCLLNGLHDEMVAAMKVSRGESPQPSTNGEVSHDNGQAEEMEGGEEEEDGWEQVGPKNKSVITRSVCDSNASPISEIFRGQMRSVVQQQGERESATLQPFFSLQLDIQHENVMSVKDALNNLVSKETIQGFTCNKTKKEVEVTRRMTLELLPPVLVMHLKCFVYDQSGGSQKVLKHIEYSVDLEINKELLATNVRSKYANPSTRKYKLFAVVNHHGPRAIGGHYTTYTFHPGLQGWVHFDDNLIRSVSLPALMKYNPPKVPYLLYYRRVDLN